MAQFRSLFGLPANSPNVILDGPDPGFNGDETEGDLDVEWSGAVAKNATIDFVIAEDTEATSGTDLAAEYVVDNNLAPVLSESFAECEANLGNSGNHFEATLWEQAAAQGITVIVAAGDSGSAACDDPNSAKCGQSIWPSSQWNCFHAIQRRCRRHGLRHHRHEVTSPRTGVPNNTAARRWHKRCLRHILHSGNHLE